MFPVSDFVGVSLLRVRHLTNWLVVTMIFPYCLTIWRKVQNVLLGCENQLPSCFSTDSLIYFLTLIVEFANWAPVQSKRLDQVGPRPSTPACFVPALLTFSLSCANREAVNSLIAQGRVHVQIGQGVFVRGGVHI